MLKREDKNRIRYCSGGFCMLQGTEARMAPSPPNLRILGGAQLVPLRKDEGRAHRVLGLYDCTYTP